MISMLFHLIRFDDEYGADIVGSCWDYVGCHVGTTFDIIVRSYWDHTGHYFCIIFGAKFITNIVS